MYILDDESNEKLDCITVVLTREEVKQLLGFAKQLLEKKSEHYHLSSEDYQKEITICMYDPERVEQRHPRIKKLIKNDE